MTRASTNVRTAGGTARRRTGAPARESPPDAADPIVVRAVRRSDLDQVIEIDAIVTGLEKRTYWRSIFRRYGEGDRPERHFLVAELDGRVVGFLIGEVRDWEFGAPPCGWVFAINVQPQARLDGIATRMLESLRERFRRSGVRKLRTILARDNNLVLSFFRSQGMTTGRFIPLEMDLDE